MKYYQDIIHVNAVKIVGPNIIPAVVHNNLPDDDAVLIVMETN
jgi:hypothetical protein